MNFSDFILNDKKLEKKIYDKYNLDNNPDKKKEKNQKNKEYKRENWEIIFWMIIKWWMMKKKKNILLN